MPKPEKPLLLSNLNPVASSSPEQVDVVLHREAVCGVSTSLAQLLSFD